MAGWAAGVFTRARNWVTDKGGAINPQAALFDQEDDNFASGLNNCVTKDGLNKPSATMDWNGQRLIGLAAGTAAAPSIAIGTTAGIYADTANQLAISLNGVTAGQIAQGTFTGTLTGFTANPTGTVNYQRIGKIVHLWITTAITATSNTGNMTMTGLPAIIQPASVTNFAMTQGANDQGTDSGTIGTVNAGTITFNLAQTAAGIVFGGGWHNTGTKGLNAGWATTYALT
jgi:hypothetical protein